MPQKSLHDKSCKEYSQSQTYDMCVFQGLEHIFHHEIGCSVPFLASDVPVCTDPKLAEKVQAIVEGRS